ncbi:hypothetical protein [Nocardiopsis sp. CNS-639]|uniref:hypothetical protein n=1 Tax=Nocardiopsis sp. CNS-639 TaxID=1169153 RepID=UPI0012DE6268|nr:hypothetical protein [Nocardiopsis sp. CNS-639]
MQVDSQEENIMGRRTHNQTENMTEEAAVPEPRSEQPQTPTPGTIWRVAGNGQEKASGDGGPALEAGMHPKAIAFGPDRCLYLCDNLYVSEHTRNCSVRKIDTSGKITRVAGNGEPQLSGMGGPAVDAGIGWPRGIAVDTDGDFYFSTDPDETGNVVLKVDGSANHTISVFAGGGQGEGDHPTDLRLEWVEAVAIGPDSHVYFADRADGRVWKVNKAGTTATVVAGNGDTSYRWVQGRPTEVPIGKPYGLAFDTSGTLYISTGRGFVYKVSPSRDKLTTVFPFTPEYGEPKSGVYGICMGQHGVLFASLSPEIVGVLTPGSAEIETIAGKHMQSGYEGDGGLATNALLRTPRDARLLGGDLFIVDRGNDRIRKIVGVDKPVTLVDPTVAPKKIAPFQSTEVVLSWQVVCDRNVSDALVSVELPTGMEFITSDRNGSTSGRVVTIPLGDLAQGTSTTVQVTTRTTATAAGVLTVPARVSATDTEKKPVRSWTSFAGLIVATAASVY